MRRWLEASRLKDPDYEQATASTSQIRVFMHLYQYGPQTISQLAAGLGVTSATASSVVSRLERLGKVRRTRSNEDRRCVFVELDPEIRKLSSQVHAARKQFIASVLSRLSAQERRTFTKGLVLFAEAIEAADLTLPGETSRGIRPKTNRFAGARRGTSRRQVRGVAS